MYRIAPSILSANFAKLGQEITDVIESGSDIISLDLGVHRYSVFDILGKIKAPVNFPSNKVIAYFLIDDSLRERNRYCHYNAPTGSYVVAINRLVLLSISVKQSQSSKMRLLLQTPIIYDLNAKARYPPSRLVGVFVN